VINTTESEIKLASLKPVLITGHGNINIITGLLSLNACTAQYWVAIKLFPITALSTLQLQRPQI